MGKLTLVNMEKHKALFEITPSFTMKGEEISHVLITNVNGQLFKAEPCYQNGTPVSKGWNYTVPGITIDSFYAMVMKLKSLNGNLNSSTEKINQLKKAALQKRTA